MDTPIVFDPTIAELEKIVSQTSLITAPDLANDTQLALVHDNRIALRDVRIRIEKSGKEKRAEALKYQKDVIAYEKQLLGIISPEEERLKALEDEATAIKERAARAALLPMRKAELAKLGLEVTDDNQILDLDNDAFVSLLNDLQAKKNAVDAAELAQMKADALKKEELAKAAEDARMNERNRIELLHKMEEEKRINDEAQRRIDAQAAAQKLLDDAKAEIDRNIKEAQDRLDANLAATIAAEADRLSLQKAQEENARIYKENQEKDAAFQEWKVQIGYKAEEADKWILQDDNGTTRAFKIYASYVR